MKTQDLLDKYKRMLSGALDCEPGDIKFQIHKDIKDEDGKVLRSEYIDINDLYYEKPNYQSICDLSQGFYKVVLNKKDKSQDVSSFKLYEMPHCCAYLVSCNANVNMKFTQKGIGTILNLLRIDIAKLLGYSSLLCTDIETNIGQRKILIRNGWKDVHSILNKRTNNKVFLSVIEL